MTGAKPHELTAEDLATYLSWWQASGMVEGVSDTPRDWFAAEPRPAASPSPARPQPATLPAVAKSDQNHHRPMTVAAPSQTSHAARQTAAKALNLDELRAALEAFDGCGLKATAKSLCFYRGAATAELMLIGEAPGRDEDLAGKPFVGRAGQLLDKMLAAIGIDETKVHIANTVYWRPPGNRTPSVEETTACQPFLERQMELVAPKIIVLLGGVAAKQVLGLSDGILKLRGKWRSVTVGERKVAALATLHPAYLLRTPAAKRQAWQDLLLIAQALAGQPK